MEGSVIIMKMKWTHFTIAHFLPGSGYGTGGIGLADLDGDGDLDVIVSRRETKTAYWFEHKEDATWIRHVIGTADSLETALENGNSTDGSTSP